MANRRWEIEEWYTAQKQLYKTLQQSTTESWLSKTKVMAMRAQEQETETIHPTECEEMILQNPNPKNNGSKRTAPPRTNNEKETMNRHQQIDKFVRNQENGNGKAHRMTPSNAIGNGSKWRRPREASRNHARVPYSKPINGTDKVRNRATRTDPQIYAPELQNNIHDADRKT